MKIKIEIDQKQKIFLTNNKMIKIKTIFNHNKTINKIKTISNYKICSMITNSPRIQLKQSQAISATLRKIIFAIQKINHKY